MQVGLIGPAMSGKTTLFELLSRTHGAFLSPDKANSATVDVPDDRLDRLTAVFKPRRTVYAKITFTDTNRLAPGERENNNRSLAHLKTMDALAIVLDAYTPGRKAGDLQADLDFCLSEMVMSDLEQIERKRERLAKTNKPSALAGVPELAVFDQLAQALEAGKMLSSLELQPGVWKELLSYNFLTALPSFLVINLSEAYGAEGPQGLPEFEQSALAQGRPSVRIYAKLEKDLEALPAQDRAIFAAEYSLPLDGKTAFIRQAYQTAGLVSFLTVGEDEVRAWTVRQAAPAQEAAGVIHKDLMNFFARAEVIHYDKLLECGSMQEAVKRGWLRSEKKEYAVRDGDIMHILSTK